MNAMQKTGTHATTVVREDRPVRTDADVMRRLAMIAAATTGVEDDEAIAEALDGYADRVLELAKRGLTIICNDGEGLPDDLRHLDITYLARIGLLFDVGKGN